MAAVEYVLGSNVSLASNRDEKILLKVAEYKNSNYSIEVLFALMKKYSQEELASTNLAKYMCELLTDANFDMITKHATIYKMWNFSNANGKLDYPVAKIIGEYFEDLGKPDKAKEYENIAEQLKNAIR